MDIVAVFCKGCNEIIYSRNQRDFRSCTCGNMSIDGGMEEPRVLFKDNNYQSITLDGDVLLKQILFYDYNYGNRHVLDEFIDGYHGKYTIVEKSNMNYFNKLVKEW